MKTFFKIIFGSCLGVLVAFLVLFFLMAGMISSMSSGSNQSTKSITSNSILHININGDITDRTYEAPMLNLSASNSSTATTGLFDIKQVIEHAKTDKNIKMIYLNVDNTNFGISSLHQFISFLEDFKSAKKPIVLYSSMPTQKTFLIGAYADSMYINPVANCEFDGMVLENMFFTGLLDKLGIQPKIFYAGEFKSATESFRLKENSEENDLQLSEILNDIYSDYLQKLSSKTNITIDSLKSMANNLRIMQAQDALQYGLVDGIKYEDEVHSVFREKLGYDKNVPLNFVSYKKYKETIKPLNETGKIAVLFAEGEIRDGKQEPGMIGGDNYVTYIRELQELARKKEIKAVVLRVNSGGGSAYASEQIWRELSILKKDVPIVVSFGDVAASGGYYIACASDRIYAQSTTITGSIGVFGMLFNVKKLLNEKLGITTDEVKTSPYADFGNASKEWSETENKAMQRNVDATYQLFMQRVNDARKLGADRVAEIAKGRVWSGIDAKTIGLVDELGTLQDAIDYAQKIAKINKPEVCFYPKDKKGFEVFFNSIIGGDEEQALLYFFNKDKAIEKYLNKIKIYEQPQARMLLNIKVK